MPTRENSKGKILDAAADLLQRHGYHGTGLNEIIRESGAPRGSLYFHFPGGKEQLAAEALAKAGEAIATATASAIHPDDDAGNSVRRLAALAAETLQASTFERGCPIATATLDIAAASELIRQSCEASYERWLGAIKDRLCDGGWSEEEARGKAILILASLQGALILARAFSSTEPVRMVGEELAQALECRPPEREARGN